MSHSSSPSDASDPHRIAVVTGASKGIGREIAVALAGEGIDIAINYKGDRQGAEETAEMIRSRGRLALTVQADVGVRAEVNRMFDLVTEKLGLPEILVNNAGRQTWAPLLELDEEDWDLTLRTNLTGTFLCTQRAARDMASQGKGCIINIGSGCNKVPFPSLIDYTSSKGGIEMFTRVAAVELGVYGITVNCIAPGAIEIERTRAESPDYARTWSEITPMGRVGRAEDVASAVIFIASPAARFISGQTLYVDGGLFTKGAWPYEVKRLI